MPSALYKCYRGDHGAVLVVRGDVPTVENVVKRLENNGHEPEASRSVSGSQSSSLLVGNMYSKALCAKWGTPREHYRHQDLTQIRWNFTSIWFRRI